VERGFLRRLIPPRVFIHAESQLIKQAPVKNARNFTHPPSPPRGKYLLVVQRAALHYSGRVYRTNALAVRAALIIKICIARARAHARENIHGNADTRSAA